MKQGPVSVLHDAQKVPMANPAKQARALRQRELRSSALEIAPSSDRKEPGIFDNRIVEILTYPELAGRLKMSVSGLRKLVRRDGNFPRLRVGHEYRFNWPAVYAYLSSKRKGQ